MRKKIILFIVEGYTDKICLELPITRILNSRELNINFQVVRGDITSDNQTTTANISSKICGIVKEHAGRILKPSDYLKIVHLVDLDGTFINDADVEDVETYEAPFYATDKIQTAHPVDIKRRNQHKSAIINRMIALPQVWRNIPYEVYYFSCNLDHVLHNNANLSNADKTSYAKIFEDSCANNPAFLPNILSDTNVLLGESHVESWDLIKQGRESLSRHSNLHFFLAHTNQNV